MKRKTKPQQTLMFANGEDTPLFSGTAMQAGSDAFIPARVPHQAGMFTCGACQDTGQVGEQFCLCEAGERARHKAGAFADFTPDEYPYVKAFVEGRIPAMLEARTQKFLDGNPKYSPARAGELAAATIASMYAFDLDMLERFVRARDVPALNALYDANVEAMEQESIRAILVQLTGSRTLIADIDAIQKQGDAP